MEDTFMNKFHGNMVVDPEMKRILSQPGFLSIPQGSQRLRHLYCENSRTFSAAHLSEFGMLCYTGSYEHIKQIVDSGHAPDLSGTEAAYHFGYATLIISGAQRLEPLEETGAWKLKHIQVLSYLLSEGMPADVPDIVGSTALHHVLTTTSVAPELDIELVRILIEEGKADVNYQNRYGEAPIFVAMKRNFIDGIQMLLEHGASMDVKDGDGITPENFYVTCGPQVTAIVRKCIAKREGLGERPREEKKCDGCGSKGERETKNLKNCARCQVARYCSKECQRQHWPTHKATCKPFNASSTITVKPFYMSNDYATLCHTSTLTRNILGEDAHPSSFSKKKQKNAFQPAFSFPTKASAESPKNIIIKAQVPFDPMGLGPAGGSKAGIWVYTKKRDLTCQIRWEDNKGAYDRLSQVVMEKGVKGTKAYFAAELRGKDELVIKVSEVLAEQPW